MNQPARLLLAVSLAAGVMQSINLPGAQASSATNGAAPVVPGRLPAAYPVPYGPTTVDAITQVLNRIHGYLDAHTPAQLVNKETGATITDFTKPDRNAIIERGHFPIIAYEWGVTYSGMLLASEVTGDSRFKDYVAKRMQFIVEKTPYFRALDEGGLRGTDNPFRGVLHP